MLNQALLNEFAQERLLREATITVKVAMNPSPLLAELANGLFKEIQRLIPYSEYSVTAGLEPSDILKYLKTLTYLRCLWVNGDSSAFTPYKTISRKLYIPVMMYQILISIGEAIDRDFSIRFVPEYSIESTDLLSVDVLGAMSETLGMLESIGFAAVKGMPKETEGELDFMACSHVEECVLSYRSSHPVYGFLASFFTQKQFNAVTGGMCRVIYGYDSDYKTSIRQAIKVTTSKSSD